MDGNSKPATSQEAIENKMNLRGLPRRLPNPVMVSESSITQNRWRKKHHPTDERLQPHLSLEDRINGSHHSANRAVYQPVVPFLLIWGACEFTMVYKMLILWGCCGRIRIRYCDVPTGPYFSVAAFSWAHVSPSTIADRLAAVYLALPYSTYQVHLSLSLPKYLGLGLEVLERMA